MLQHRRGLIVPSRFARRKLPPSTATVGLPLEDGLEGNCPICQGTEQHLSGEPQSAPYVLWEVLRGPSRSNFWCKLYILYTFNVFSAINRACTTIPEGSWLAVMMV